MSTKLASIVRSYARWKKNNPDLWIAYCESQNDIKSAIYYAAISRNESGRKHPHQYRLTAECLERFAAQLIEKSSAIEAVRDFDGLLSIISASREPGIGDLAVYDTAVRIGAFLQIYPNKIYLHAGTRVGVTKLCGKIDASWIDKRDMPKELRESSLTCYELEDLLCIYKDEF